MNQVKPDSVLKGATILGVAAVISKLLGTFQKIPLQNIAGDSVFGIYNAVYPLYTAILILATAGFPIAVSKFISEGIVAGDYKQVRYVFRLAMIILMVVGICSFGLLYFGAVYLAALIGNPHLAPAIQSVSFAMLIVPMMSALRGYFQGFQNMAPTAVSQVMEQFARVTTMLGLLFFFIYLNYDESWIAAGAMFGSVIGAAAGLLVMVYYWLKEHHNREFNVAQSALFQSGGLARRFITYTISVSFGLLALPILNLVDTFTIPRILMNEGLDALQAMEHFGVYNRGLPLVQLVMMIATSMSVALIPAIAEAKKSGNWNVIRMRIRYSIKWTWLIGLASSAGLIVLAKPMNVMFFEDSKGTGTMAILAISALFGTLAIVTGSILQGLGAEKILVLHFLIAAICKTALNVALLPVWGINGAAISAVFAFAIAAWFNVWHIRRKVETRLFTGMGIGSSVLAAFLMSLVLAGIVRGIHYVPGLPDDLLSNRGFSSLVALGSVAIGVMVYMWGLLRFRAITAVDLQEAPNVARKFSPYVRKLK